MAGARSKQEEITMFFRGFIRDDRGTGPGGLLNETGRDSVPQAEPCTTGLDGISWNCKGRNQSLPAISWERLAVQNTDGTNGTNRTFFTFRGEMYRRDGTPTGEAG